MERYVPVFEMDQTQQYDYLQKTDNAQTISEEEEILRELYGEPDDDGIYGKPEKGS